jgi:hypothetical protein
MMAMAFDPDWTHAGLDGGTVYPTEEDQEENALRI